MKILIFMYLYIYISDDGGYDSLMLFYIVSLLKKINKMFVSALHLLFFIKLRFPRGKYIKCYTQEMIKKYIYIFNAWLWIGFIRKFGCMI